MGRIERQIADLPEGKAGEASRFALKKQLATAKAVAIREQRKREQAEREARRVAEAAAARAAAEQE